MPTRIRKIRKHRGSRTHGWGQTSGHRGAGSQGGAGKAGGQKHKWTYTVAHEPNRFGKHGFYHKNKQINTINVGELDQIATELYIHKKATKKHNGIFIDLNVLGIDKLLGSGRVNKKLIINVKDFSSKAASKIKEAKGNILSAN